MRERRESQPVAVEPREALAPSAAAPLDLLQRARNSEGDERRSLAGQLNALLSLPAGAGREERAQFLLEKLDDEAFHDLFDAAGVPCRAVAVEAVLALGFPYALHIDPDDLQYLRSVKPASRFGPQTWARVAIASGVIAALTLLALALFWHF